MSTPHVSGVAALLLSYKPDATPDELFAAITQTAVDRGANGLDDSYGYGVIDALAAVKHLEEVGDSGNGDNGNNPTPPITPPGACVDIEMAFRTDRYAYELSYTLRNTSDGDKLWDTSGSNLRNFQRYTQRSCINPSSCYRFDINDSFGDGLSGSGIRLTFDGKVLYEGANYGYGGYRLIGNGC
jgi:hypothetical protein